MLKTCFIIIFFFLSAPHAGVQEKKKKKEQYSSTFQVHRTEIRPWKYKLKDDKSPEKQRQGDETVEKNH